MIRRLPVIGLLLMLAGFCLPQTGSGVMTPDVRRVADKLACKCGACNNTVATCQMLQCHYSSPAREKIAKMLAEGMSDQAIIDSFVKEIGLAALAVPPARGFNLMAWVMPFVGIGLGLALIAVYMKRFRKPASATVGSEPQIEEEYRKRIEKEMAEFDK